MKRRGFLGLIGFGAAFAAVVPKTLEGFNANNEAGVGSRYVNSEGARKYVYVRNAGQRALVRYDAVQWANKRGYVVPATWGSGMIGAATDPIPVGGYGFVQTYGVIE